MSIKNIRIKGSFEESMSVLKDLEKAGSISSLKTAIEDWTTEGEYTIYDIDEKSIKVPAEVTQAGFEISGKKGFSDSKDIELGVEIKSEDDNEGTHPLGEVQNDGTDSEDIPSNYLRVKEVWPYINQIFRTYEVFNFGDQKRQFTGQLTQLKEFAVERGFIGIAVLHEASALVKYRKTFSEVSTKLPETLDLIANAARGCVGSRDEKYVDQARIKFKTIPELAKALTDIVELRNPTQLGQFVKSFESIKEKYIESGEKGLSMFQEYIDQVTNAIETEDPKMKAMFAVDGVIPQDDSDPERLSNRGDKGFGGFDNVKDLQELVDGITEDLKVQKVTVQRLDQSDSIDIELPDGTIVKVSEDEDEFIASYDDNLLEANKSLSNLLSIVLNTPKEFSKRIQRIGRFKRTIKRPAEAKKQRKERIKSKMNAIKSEKDPLTKRQLKAELEIEKIKLKRMHGLDVAEKDVKGLTECSSSIILELTKSLSTKNVQVDDSTIKGAVLFVLSGSTSNIDEEDLELVKGLCNSNNGFISSASSFGKDSKYRLCFLTTEKEFSEADKTLSTQKIDKELLATNSFYRLKEHLEAIGKVYGDLSKAEKAMKKDELDFMDSIHNHLGGDSSEETIDYIMENLNLFRSESYRAKVRNSENASADFLASSIFEAFISSLPKSDRNKVSYKVFCEWFKTSRDKLKTELHLPDSYSNSTGMLGDFVSSLESHPDFESVKSIGGKAVVIFDIAKDFVVFSSSNITTGDVIKDEKNDTYVCVHASDLVVFRKCFIKSDGKTLDYISWKESEELVFKRKAVARELGEKKFDRIATLSSDQPSGVSYIKKEFGATDSLEEYMNFLLKEEKHFAAFLPKKTLVIARSRSYPDMINIKSVDGDMDISINAKTKELDLGSIPKKGMTSVSFMEISTGLVNVLVKKLGYTQLGKKYFSFENPLEKLPTFNSQAEALDSEMKQPVRSVMKYSGHKSKENFAKYGAENYPTYAVFVTKGSRLKGGIKLENGDPLMPDVHVFEDYKEAKGFAMNAASALKITKLPKDYLQYGSEVMLYPIKDSVRKVVDNFEKNQDGIEAEYGTAYVTTSGLIYDKKSFGFESSNEKEARRIQESK